MSLVATYDTYLPVIHSQSWTIFEPTTQPSAKAPNSCDATPMLLAARSLLIILIWFSCFFCVKGHMFPEKCQFGCGMSMFF